MKERKKRKVFVDGPVRPLFVGESIAKHRTKTRIGAHNIFLGQVRNDIIEGKEVAAIEYTAYGEMAEPEFEKIREEAFEKFDLECLHIYHSLGVVEAGEISLFVFASSPHRDAGFKAVRYIVDEIKSRVPIFGKELFTDSTHGWKKND
jgi:molybdopterin synthase catalytic subunit